MTLLRTVCVIILTIGLIHFHQPCFAGPVDAQAKPGDSQLKDSPSPKIASTDSSATSASPSNSTSKPMNILHRDKRKNNPGTCDLVGSPDFLNTNIGKVDVSKLSRAEKCDKACILDNCTRGECAWTAHHGHICQCFNNNGGCCGTCHV